MAFVYYGQGVSSLYGDFVERLVSHLALEGTEITHQSIAEAAARMDVRHTGETGQLAIEPDGKNVRVTYTVDREKKEIGRGLMGAIAGGGIGSILGGVLRGERDGGEMVGDIAGGAAAGGAYEAYRGYEESRENRTAFAELLAACVREVEDELQAILAGQEEAREALRERGRQKREEEEAKEEEMRELLDDLYGDLLAVQEEIDLLASEGLKITKPKSRADRAEKLYLEAEEALDGRKYAIVAAKAKAARSMVESAQESLDALENE
ncbi:hypothetical protein FGU65_06960 [Methanoculleus sp. FWC-SCC1]|uniref:Glycine zipper domain-containing protein n=1 Tax=Methanoculleus frigidifontis TaxID=2584085 RepID=A0ABT8M9N9_9EURY|nr:hypothetical protein [Methanoculleus sp. FWC-SCC1]MDN7024629.1 hypothetical protein [Methanoculleus sp. FWC-SCC1]